MSSSIVTLGSSSVFFSTAIVTTGYIYVPRSLWASYRTATNWSSLSARIMSV